MSKANKKAFDWLPKRKDGRKRYYNCNDDDIRRIYAKGYRKAEKDNELTWEDIRDICRMWIESKTPFGVTGEALSIEVLKRFKEMKEKK